MHWDREIDVLVVGSGGSGLIAAARAADRGGKVLLIEKSNRFGGTTALSGGCIWAPTNHLQDQTVGDSFEKAFSYLNELTDHHTSPTMLEVFINKSRPMLQFLDQESRLTLANIPKYCDYYPEFPGGLPGGRTIEVEPFDGQLLTNQRHLLRDPQKMTLLFGQISLTARDAHLFVTAGKKGKKLAIAKIATYLASSPKRRRYGRDRYLTLGQGLVAGLWDLCQSKGVQFLLETTICELVTIQNRVIGARIKSGSKIQHIKTNGGIILASGGFSRNDQLKQIYHGQPTSANWGAAVAEDTGDAFTLCQSLQAQTALLNEAWWMPVMRVPGENFARSVIMERSLPGSIVVNQDGERFTNESGPYEDFVNAMRAQHRSCPAWLIISHFHRHRYTLGPLFPASYHPSLLWPRKLKKDWLHIGSRIDELASKIGINGSTLEKTISRFNSYALEGEDPEFQRGKSKYDQYYADSTTGLPNPCLYPLAEPPFYAVPLFPGDLGTKGGLVINENSEVIGNQGPISGLFAAGNASANPIGNCYPGSGGTLGPGMTFGYIASESAMKLAN